MFSHHIYSSNKHHWVRCLTMWIVWIFIMYPHALRSEDTPNTTISIHHLSIGQEQDNLAKLSNIAVDEASRRAYLTGNITRYIAIIDLDSLKLIDTIDSGVDGFVTKFLVVNPVTNDLYIFTPDLNKLTHLDPTNGGVTGATIQASEAVAVDPDTGRVFVSYSSTGRVNVYSSSLGYIDNISGLNTPTTMMVKDGLLYILHNLAASDSDSGVSVYNASTLVFEQKYSMPSGFSVKPKLIHVTDDSIFINTRTQQSLLAVIDKTTGTGTTTTVGEHPGHLESYDGNLYMMTGYPFEAGYLPGEDGAYGVIEIRDASSGTKTGELYTGSDGMVLLRDRLGGSAIYLVDPASGTLVDTIKVGSWPTDMVLDEKLGRLYVLLHYESKIAAYNVNSLELEYEISLGLQQARTDAISVLTMDPTGTYLYAAIPELDSITMVSADGTGTAKTVTISGYDHTSVTGPSQLHLGVSSSLNQLYVLLRKNEFMNIYDSTSLEFISSVYLPGVGDDLGEKPLNMITVDEVNQRLYVGPKIIDLTIAETTGSLPNGAMKVVEVSPDGDYIYVWGRDASVTGSEYIVEYNADLTVSSKTWTFTPTVGPYLAFGFDFNRGRLVTASVERGVVDVYNGPVFSLETGLVLGLGKGSEGWRYFLDTDLNGTGWYQIDWQGYNSISGASRIAVGDVDGDYRDEIIVGMTSEAEGWFRVIDDDFSGTAWGRINWILYDKLIGETRPAAGDIDGDGKDEIIVGLGSGSQGWIQIIDDDLTAYDWAQVDWDDYNSENGETYPAVFYH